MIFTKRFICIIISICIVVSCVCCFSFADYINNLELVGDAQYALGELILKTNLQQDIINIKQFLPILDQSGLPYQSRQLQQLRFNKINISTYDDFVGAYSIYLVLDFYCESSSVSINYGDVISWLLTVGMTDGEQDVSYPVVEIGQKENPSNYSGYFYKFSAYIKWDVYSDGGYAQFYMPNNHNGGFFLLDVDDHNWIISASNFCLVNYNVINNDELSNLSNISQQLANIYSKCVNLVNYTNSINQFISSNFGVNNNTPNSIWWLLKGLYDNLGSSSNTNSIWYKLTTTAGVLANSFRYNSAMDSVSILRNLPNGFFNFCIDVFTSINDYNIWKYNQEMKTINSTEYQAGESIKDEISDAGGYGSLSGFSSSASGFGNIGLIGTIFNGLSSAFRWFTNDTKNNIDAVQPNRDVNETISHYLDDNLDLIQEYLTTEADSND